MRKKLIVGLLVVLIIGGMFLFVSRQSAAEQVSRFSSVIPFTTAGGMFCFFDQNNGMVYVYDKEMKNCIQTKRITKLGSPSN